METSEDEIMIQGLRLARGMTEQQAKERIRIVKEIEKRAREIELWAIRENKDGTHEKLELMVFAKILTKYNKRRRHELIKALHQVTVTEVREIMKEAKTIREMGQLQRQ